MVVQKGNFTRLGTSSVSVEKSHAELGFPMPPASGGLKPPRAVLYPRELERLALSMFPCWAREVSKTLLQLLHFTNYFQSPHKGAAGIWIYFCSRAFSHHVLMLLLFPSGC